MRCIRATRIIVIVVFVGFIMFKFMILALVLLGVFIGVQYSSEIKEVVNEDHIEQLKDGAESIVDKVEVFSN